ncbi:MAG: hypothetical protein IJN78_03195 [Clostridia bacterium]|nr:hypothetical protein [Clostridia bacterium]
MFFSKLFKRNEPIPEPMIENKGEQQKVNLSEKEQEKVAELNIYLESPTTQVIVNFVKQFEHPYEIIVNNNSIEVYYSGGSSRFDFEANGIQGFDKVVTYHYDLYSTSIYKFSWALNYHLGDAYIIQDVVESFVTRYNEYESDYGIDLKYIVLSQKLQSF